ncbi:hypothetical protein ABDB91_17325 [Desulfoscipio sp. XC116]|uniref:hypothetical protein n=1 Tax=Desulfoscipio sp. XC116 TaxID=3144975 RepID=UPI00325B7C53
MADTLLIPVDVRAIMVGANPTVHVYSNMENNFMALYKDSFDNNIESALFQVKAQERTGIHLHWSLPDGLTRGKEQPDGAIGYPIVPNRWLVIRLWENDVTHKVASRAFLVQSDQLLEDCNAQWYNEFSKTYPYLYDEGQPWRYLGRSFPLEEEVVGGEPVRLTAVGPGTPHFAAYYPFCENVFGFCDTLIEPGGQLAGVNLTYVVCGYYQDVKNDEQEPLSNIKSLGECEAMFGWTLHMDPEPEFPMSMLCHGMICDLPWIDGATRYETGVPSDVPPGRTVIEPRLAVGNTSAEALAALQDPAKRAGGTDERLMQLLMNDEIWKLAAADGVLDAEIDLHGKEFEVVKPQELLDIKKKEGRDNAVSPGREAMSLLASIRARQRELRHRQGELEQQRRAVYEIWCYYTLAYLKHNQAATGSLGQKIKDRIALIEQLNTAIERTATLIDHDKALFLAMLGEDYETVDKPDQRFYVPNNPVLLMSDIDRYYAHGFDGRYAEENLLVCRCCAQIITRMRIGPIEGKLPVPVLVEPRDFLEKGAITLPHIGELMEEALLLSLSFTRLLAEQVCQAAGITDPETKKYIEETIRAMQVSGQGYDGAVPSKVAVNYYKAGWYPLFLEWEVSFYPDEDILCAAPDFQNWAFDAVDYRCIAGERIIQSGRERTLDGRMLITPHAAGQLSYQIRQGMKGSEALSQRAESLNILSQAISGLNEEFLMRKQRIPMALYASENEDAAMVELVRRYAGEFCDTQPLYQEVFAPVRAGYFHFNKIWITDSFGRFQELNRPDVYASETMRSGETALVKDVMLPPRLVQPARLMFQWICKDREEEAGFVDTASPICGWLIPNHFDQSLQVFSTEGNAIGSLQVVDFGTGMAWKNAPGTPFAAEIPKDINPELYGLLKSLLDADSSAFYQCMQCIDTAFSDMSYASDKPTEALFVGRPLAVVRASLQLQQYGSPERYKQLEELKKAPDPTGITDITKAGFIVRLGMQKHSGDGMIGFYKMKDGRVDYGTFYSSRCRGSEGLVSDDNSLTLQICAREPEKLTILMEASGSVFIESGILPVKKVCLARELVGQALDKLYFTIFMPSVITGKAHMHMPLLTIDGKRWEWVSARDDKLWNQPIVPDNTDCKAFYSAGRQQIIEGWLKMKQDE